MRRGSRSTGKTTEESGSPARHCQTPFATYKMGGQSLAPLGQARLEGKDGEQPERRQAVLPQGETGFKKQWD